MSTHSRVGYTHANGTISSIYIHFDGYYEEVGRTLLEHYNSLERAEEIVALGDASTLDVTLEKSVFYSRDHGETGVEAELSKNLDEFYQDCRDSAASFAYLWLDGGWKTGLNHMTPLKDEFEKAL